MKRILLSLTMLSLTAGILLVACAGAQATFEQRARLFDYDAKAPLDVREGSVEEVEGVQVHDITYASPKGGRVPAFLVTSSGKGPFAGIVLMHWGQGDRTEFFSEGVLYAKAGAVVLMIDAPYNRPGYQSADEMTDPEKQRDMYVQLVVDLRRGFDLLLARSDVDPKRLGYVGHSLGATQGGTLAGVEKRVRAYVLMGGLPSLTELSGKDWYSEFIRTHYSKEQIQKYIDLLAPINPENFIGHSAPAAILFQFAKHDRYISEQAAAAYEKAAGEPKEARWYFTSHEFNDLESLSDRADWLRWKLQMHPVVPLLQMRIARPRVPTQAPRSQEKTRTPVRMLA